MCASVIGRECSRINHEELHMRRYGVRHDNYIDARRLALMKPAAGIANIARGEIIDETALADALKASRLRHAYLDLFHTEPLPRESPLWALPNVLISPHNAGASTGTYARGVEIFLRNLRCRSRIQSASLGRRPRAQGARRALVHPPRQDDASARHARTRHLAGRLMSRALACSFTMNACACDNTTLS